MTVDEEDFQRLRKDLDRVRTELDGNGKPGLKREVQMLQNQTKNITQALYHNPDTGEAGLVATSRTTLDLLQKMDRKTEVRDAERATEARLITRGWKIVAWIVGLIGFGGLSAFVRSLLLGG